MHIDSIPPSDVLKLYLCLSITTLLHCVLFYTFVPFIVCDLSEERELVQVVINPMVGTDESLIRVC